LNGKLEALRILFDFLLVKGDAEDKVEHKHGGKIEVTGNKFYRT